VIPILIHINLGFIFIAFIVTIPHRTSDFYCIHSLFKYQMFSFAKIDVQDI